MNEVGYHRTIQETLSTSAIYPPPNTEENLRTWLAGAAHTTGLTYLLAHTEVAVVWGQYLNGALELSSDTYGPDGDVLGQDTLHTVRLFGPGGELLLWRAGADWRAQLITDGTGALVEVIDEAYLLWGTDFHPDDRPDAPFRLLVEGRQGIVHAPPRDSAGRDACMTVRHYLAEDMAGVTRIAFSRLVNIEPIKVTKGASQ
ncbi:MAG TPA: CRISPR-associated protein Csx19 [Roseiflexaceae bacterium]|nr:CRISPR-associated protein Csx19 [Roseiflexaceae bacterium]